MSIWEKSPSNKIKENNDLFTLNTSEIFSYNAYISHQKENEKRVKEWHQYENKLLDATLKEFTFRGFCYVCKDFQDFFVDYNYCHSINNIKLPNWRERLVCPCCHLNNRMRATIHIFEQEFKPNKHSTIYLTEQMTPTYSWFKSNYNNVIGSEYLGDSIAPGSYNNKGIRNEDTTKLSFSSAELDCILSFDVFEHISNYTSALKECYRCLKPGGVLFFSIPFVKSSQKNIVRAVQQKNGEISHILPAEYHGDPTDSNGCLCFYHFGWDFLNNLKNEGFKDPRAILYWSQDYAYLGGEQIIFAAKKGKK